MGRMARSRVSRIDPDRFLHLHLWSVRNSSIEVAMNCRNPFPKLVNLDPLEFDCAERDPMKQFRHPYERKNGLGRLAVI